MLLQTLPVCRLLLQQLFVLVIVEHFAELSPARVFDILRHLPVLLALLADGFALFFVLPGVIGMDFEYLPVLVIVKVEQFLLSLRHLLGALFGRQPRGITRLLSH